MNFTSERKLWCLVLMQAICDGLKFQADTTTDTKSVSRWAKRHTDRHAVVWRQADTWIRDGKADFREVCTLAGFDPDFIRDRYMAGCIDGSVLMDQRNHSYARSNAPKVKA